MDISIKEKDTGTFDVSGALVSGVELLAQRALYVLLTKADDPLREDEGTTLASLLEEGAGGYDEKTLFNLVNIAVAETSRILKENEDDTYSDDERLSSVILKDVKKNFDTIDISILVISVSGETYYTEGTYNV